MTLSRLAPAALLLAAALAGPATALPASLDLPHLVFPQERVQAPMPDRAAPAPLPGPSS